MTVGIALLVVPDLSAVRGRISASSGLNEKAGSGTQVRGNRSLDRRLLDVISGSSAWPAQALRDVHLT